MALADPLSTLASAAISTSAATDTTVSSAVKQEPDASLPTENGIKLESSDKPVRLH